LLDTNFGVLRFTQIATPEGRELTLKDKPAVYAWYRQLKLAEAVGTPDAFLARISELMSAKLSDQYSNKLGFLYEVVVQESAGPMSRRSLLLLESIAQHQEGRNRVSDILETATFLQAPLYVGKALSLRRRIGEHVTGGSGLLSRLDNAHIPIQSCVLRFRYVNEADVAALAACLDGGDGEYAPSKEDAIATLLEELLTRLSPSAFVRRPG
jgi:hypothetical protein